MASYEGSILNTGYISVGGAPNEGKAFRTKLASDTPQGCHPKSLVCQTNKRRKMKHELSHAWDVDSASY